MGSIVFNIFTEILGYVGTLFLVLSFQCKKEKTLFIFQLLSAAFFVSHYALKGSYTGMAMDGMCLIRSVMMASGKKHLTGKPIMCVLLAVICVLCVITWEDIFSVFPMIALLVSTIALFSGDGRKIRIAQFFVTSPAWLTYNIHVLSVPGIICESLDMLSCIVFWIRRRMIMRSKP